MKKILLALIAILAALLGWEWCCHKHVKCPSDKKIITLQKAGTDKKFTVESPYSPNELVVNFANYTPAVAQEIADYLTDAGFTPTDTCPCSDQLQLWGTEDQTVDVIDVADGAKSKGGGVGGDGISPNFFIEFPKTTGFLPNPVSYDTIQHPGPVVRVAVIDTGVDTAHAYLDQHMHIASGGACMQDKRYGRNMLDNEPITPYDQNGHGTHVSGIIVGVPQGLAGADDGVKIQLLNIRFTDGSSKSGSLFKAVCGMYYALNKDVKVMNLSWGYWDTVPPRLMIPVIQQAKDQGVVIVAGVGNDGAALDSSAAKFWPAGFSTTTNNQNVISVGAYDNIANDLASLSNQGGPASMNVIAPGVSISSSYIKATLGDLTPPLAFSSGTSMATAFVSRTAAIIIGKYGLSGEQVKEKIIITSAPPHRLLQHAIAILP
ncbi:MAG TPA: S8 family serine peptidase [Saprospiraceae bacterium]|nr:S8 family serine peptidase [Saprospiraceae bacterium]